MSRDVSRGMYAVPRGGNAEEEIDAPDLDAFRPPPLTSPIASALTPRPEERPPTSPQVAALPPPRRANPGVAPVPVPALRSLNLPAADEPVVAAPPAAPVAEVEPILPANGVSLAGLSEADVRNAMGHPDAVTRKGPQTVWTYTGNDCAVEVIFFLDVMRQSTAALDTKTVGPDGQTPRAAPCMRIAVKATK